MIRKALEADGAVARVNPDDLWPVSGYWKSQDVYRVEGEVLVDGCRLSLGSWDTMTLMVRRGVGITYEGRHLEVWAK